MSRRRTIGVLSPYLGGFYFGGLLTGIQQHAEQHDVQVIAIQSAGELFDLLPIFELPVAWDQVEGWVIIPGAASDETLAQLKHSLKPMVTLSMLMPHLHCPAVLPNNHGGTAAAVHHLLDHGHTRIGFVGCLNQEDIRQRYLGYQHALAERGITPDPALFFAATDQIDFGGRDAGQRMLEAGLPCSAVVTGTDMNAIGVMEVLQEAGHRVPEDVAIIGFDDMESAQYLSPPLTSVRQPFDMLGGLAARLLLEQMDGRVIPPEPIYVDTLLIRRHSCGCSVDDVEPGADLADDAASQSWTARLERQLVELALHPKALPAGAVPATIWPGVAHLVAGLAAVVGRKPRPSLTLTTQAWHEALTLAPNIETLNAMLSLLEREGMARIDGDDRVAQLGELQSCMAATRLELIRAWQSYERDRRQYLDHSVEVNYRINLNLLGMLNASCRDVGWLSLTPMTFGCLALWPSDHEDIYEELEIVSVYSRNEPLDQLVGRRYAPRKFPPDELFVATEKGNRRDILILIPIRTPARDWGVLALSGPVEIKIIGGLGSMTQWAGMLSTALEREQLLQSLERQQHTLQSMNQDLRQAKFMAEEANELKSKFLANMSHELRTPLNAILNFARFIGDEEIGGPLNEQQSLFRQRLLVNADHLLGLINDVLDLTKIESGHMELLCAEVELPPLLQGVMATTAVLTREKNVELTLEAPDDLPTVWGDKTRVRQVLINLLSNAAKFTDEGQIVLRAREVEDGFVEIAVQDSGIGVAPEHQQTIFEEFKQVQSNLAREYQGTGLGLPICKRLVEMHGGRMWLESTPGQGSTFFFTIPVARFMLEPTAGARG